MTPAAERNSPMCRIHSCWAPVGARSALSEGRARKSTVMSVASMKIGRDMAANPAQAQGPARSVVCAVCMVAVSLPARRPRSM